MENLRKVLSFLLFPIYFVGLFLSWTYWLLTDEEIYSRDWTEDEIESGEKLNEFKKREQDLEFDRKYYEKK